MNGLYALTGGFAGVCTCCATAVFAHGQLWPPEPREIVFVTKADTLSATRAAEERATTAERDVAGLLAAVARLTAERDEARCRVTNVLPAVAEVQADELIPPQQLPIPTREVMP